MFFAFWDSVRGRYVAYYRQCRGLDDSLSDKGPQLGISDKGWVRDVLTSTSPDFINWTDPKWIRYPGAPREQIYLNQIRPYYRAKHLFVGFPGRFMAGREIEKGLPLLEHPAYKYASISETLFMSSRDGVHFKRWGEALIRPGTAASAFSEVIIETFGAAGEELVHHAGHAIGLGHPEAPELVLESDRVIESGMVLPLAPGIYGKPTGGIRLAHASLITAAGFERLSNHELGLA